MTRPACPPDFDRELWEELCIEVERLLKLLDKHGILVHTSYDPHHYSLEKELST